MGQIRQLSAEAVFEALKVRFSLRPQKSSLAKLADSLLCIQLAILTQGAASSGSRFATLFAVSDLISVIAFFSPFHVGAWKGGKFTAQWHMCRKWGSEGKQMKATKPTFSWL